MIEYPIKKSEFEVQAELYSELKKANFDVRGEISIKKKRNVRGATRGARFDLVVFNNKQPIAVIEVKDSFRKERHQEHSKASHYYSLSQCKQFTFFANDDYNDLINNLNTLK